jgi:hypothetical protein
MERLRGVVQTGQPAGGDEVFAQRKHLQSLQTSGESRAGIVKKLSMFWCLLREIHIKKHRYVGGKALMLWQRTDVHFVG